jgi:hypothetical protein
VETFVAEDDTVKIRRTNRGFKVAEFIDRHGEKCSIQESSLATEYAIWLGLDDIKLQVKGWHPAWPERYRKMTKEEQKNILTAGRMHLTQEMAAALIPLLQHFVETGRLPDEEG